MIAQGWDPSALPRGRGAVHLLGDGPVRELVLDNPAARNAMGPGMMADLAHAVDRLQADPPAAVVIHGAGGRAFCAGGDLKAVREQLLAPGTATGMAAFMAGVLDRLATLPCRVIAAVEGAALGGGSELLTACDLVIAARDARIGFVHASLGVSPGWGGGARLVRQLGSRRAVALLAPTGPPTATRAHRLGLVDELCDSGSALSVAHERAAFLARSPLTAVHAAVAIARSGARDAELGAFERLWGGPDHLAALAALTQGRR